MPTKQEIKEFSEIIEQINDHLQTGYMDAITHHCETTGLEIEVAATLITPALKAKIREEAQEINLIKKTSKLPL
jgi:hypothetical protein